jgi:predicted acyltransferase
MQAPDELAMKSSHRLLSLDAFRGLTIAAMILVNNPGSREHRFGFLEHADWHGWTPTDLIFPFFIFIVGASIAYAIRKYSSAGTQYSVVHLRILRRTVILLSLGVFLNFFDDLLHYVYGHEETLALGRLRILGVLQRIAMVYFVTSLLALHCGIRVQMILALVLLLGYWMLLSRFPDEHNLVENLSPEENVVRAVDRSVLGDDHLFTRGRNKPTDPEGLLSTFPAIVTGLLGYWTGLYVQRKPRKYLTVGWLLLGGLICTFLGLAWHTVLPINKRIWTSSFVMFSGGAAIISFAVCFWILDVIGWRRVGVPFHVLGINAFFAYFTSHMLDGILSTAVVDHEPVRIWVFESFLLPWHSDPRVASLVYAVVVVTCFWVGLWWITRRRGGTLRV